METERGCHPLKGSTTMRAFVFGGVVLAVLVMSFPGSSKGAAGKFDGSAPVICSSPNTTAPTTATSSTEIIVATTKLSAEWIVSSAM